MRFFKKTSLALGCAAVSAGAAVGAYVQQSSVPDASQSSIVASETTDTTVTFTSFHESIASETPRDWATNADHIAEVSVVSERAGETDGSSVERFVTIRVDTVNWSRDGAESLPATFETSAFGWFTSENGLAEIAALDAPRLEPNHKYLAALVLLEPRCNPDDGLVIEGGWTLIGSGGAIPFDGRDVGSGEVEGQGGAEVDGLRGSMADKAGTAENPSAIVEIVEAANADPRPEQAGDRIGC